MAGYTPSTNPYAQPADLITYGMTAAALSTPATNTQAQTQSILGASEIADSYLRQQFALPLVSWGADLVQHVCWLAQYTLINLRGFNPESAADVNYLEKYKLAKKWFEDVAAGRVSPSVTDSSPGAVPGKPEPAAQPHGVSPSQAFGRSGTRGTNRR